MPQTDSVILVLLLFQIASYERDNNRPLWGFAFTLLGIIAAVITIMEIASMEKL
jgi:hypothetical protein